MKKTIRFAILFLLPAMLLLSQSLVEVSKQEQERRAKLKGKNVKVITNADLKSVKKTAAVTMAEASSAVTAEPADREYTDALTAERAYDEGGGSPFATAVLPDTLMVENPEFALYPADGSFAEIPFGGFLELELSARNGPGDDIAIYARRSGSERGTPIEDGIPLGAESLAFPGALQYGVLVRGDTGDWEAVGQGMGLDSPETFDLGYLPGITRIRIVFRAYGNASADVRADYYRLTPQGLSMGIDAVEALH